MAKLTKPQHFLLRHVAALTLSDGSGEGLFAFGPAVTMAVRLERMGLVSLSAGWPVHTYVRITDAGREYLKNAEPRQ